MPQKVPHPVRPGGLSTADHDEITRLAGLGWGSTSIARKIEKHPSTVQWFMYRSGLKAPKESKQEPYYRNGILVTPFTPDEDAFIEALRVQDYSLREIAELSAKRFEHRRTQHTIYNRLVMLAAREVSA